MSATPVPRDVHEQSSSRPSRLPQGARALLREPLLHFLLLGALLYGAARVFAPAAADSTIVIDAARVERLASLYQLQTGTPASATERERLVQDFVRDEVLVREARKLGLDEGDELVRRRMVQKMEFLNASVTDLAQPTDSQLREFHRAHAAQFTAPARLSFSQVFFSPDVRGPDAARDAAREAAHEATRAAQAADPSNSADTPRGDRSPVATRFENVTREQVQLAFGQRPIVEALLQAPLDQWMGPVESGFGWHLVRVSQRAEPTPLSFEQAREAVAAAWQRQARQQAEGARLADAMRKYAVVRQDQPAGAK